MIMDSFSSIPSELKALPQWVCWRYEQRRGKSTKVPYQISGVLADTTDRSTWATFDAARAAHAEPMNRFYGVGFVFAADDPYCGIDLDDCIENGRVAPLAQEIIHRLGGYAEVSPSGTGVKVWVRATLGDRSGKHWHKPHEVECYNRSRYFTVTGNTLPGSPQIIPDAQDAVDAIYGEYEAVRSERTTRKAATTPNGRAPSGRAGGIVNVDEVVRRASAAANGAKFTALWKGDASEYPSASEADLALASIVAFYVGPNTGSIETVMRVSGLKRDKWEEHSDYLQRTIARALEGKTEFFKAPTRREPRSVAGGTGAVAPGETTPLILDPADPLRTARMFMAHRHTIDNDPTLHHHQGEFFEWDGTRFTEVPGDQVRSRLYLYLERAQVCVGDGDSKELVPFRPNRAKIDNAVDALRAVSHLSNTVVDPAWIGTGETPAPALEILAVRNGLLHLPTEKLLRHSPRFFSTRSLPFAFDPEAPSPKHWRSFMAQLWPDDPESVETLEEWMGYSLTLDTRQQKILLIVGPPRSGKGTIARIWTAMLGSWSVAAPTLAGLETNFGLWPLIGKSLAIISDARLSGRPDQAKIVERLLSISGEDVQTIDRKHREPWTGRLGVRIVVLTNEIPRLADPSGAMANRFVVLRLTQSFLGTEDTGLEARLLGELPRILRLAMEGRRRLVARGRFAQPESAADAVLDLRELASPITQFIDECCELGPTFQVPIEVFFQGWCAWCQAHGRDRHGISQTLGRDLKAAVPGIGETRPRSVDGRVRHYTGIRLLPRGPQWSADQSIARGGEIPA